MTIASTARKAGPLLGNGSTTSFSFSFKVFATSDIKVAIANSAGVETVLVENTHYTVSLNANQETSPGGAITYPISGSPLPSGSVLSIIGDLDYGQPLDLPSGGNFNPTALENQLDRTVMQVQQLKEQVDRSAKLPQTSAADAESLVADIIRLADSADNLDTVAGSITGVNTTATNIADVNTVAGSIANVNATGGSIANVNTVATNIASVNTNAANISAIQGAAANAVTATTKAAEAASSASEAFGYLQAYRATSYGALAADPVVDPNGNPPTVGDEYFNTTMNLLKRFNGVTWQASDIATADLAAHGGSALVGYQQAGAGAVARTAQDKLRDVVSVLDFGAVGDGVTNDTSAWGAWVAAPGSKYVPPGSYLVSGITKVYRTPTFVNVADTNHAAGLASLERVTTGNANATFGNSAGAAITTGSQNTAIGKSALETMDSGSNNTAVGFGAMRYAAGATANQNTCLGSFAGNAITTGGNNVAVGHNTLLSLTTGTINTALGQGALAYAVTGSYNVGVGYHALLNYQGSDGVAVGTETLMNCSTGTGNTGVGRSVLKALTTGQLNTGIGRLAGTGVTTGSNGVFVGDSAGWLTTTGNNNTAVGMTSLSSNVTGENNTAIGHGALLSTTSSRNVAVGRYAGLSLAASDENVAVGANALYNCTTGRANTAVGYNALSTGVTTFVGCSALGHSATVTASNQVQLGASGTTTFAYGAVQDRSDARDKAEVRGTVLGLDFINALRPVDFKWDYREDYGWGTKDGSKKRSRFHHGLIAQEVRDVCNAAGIDFGGFQDHSINGGRDVMSIGYAELIGPLIKAVQQLSDEVDALKAAL